MILGGTDKKSGLAFEVIGFEMYGRFAIIRFRGEDRARRVALQELIEKSDLIHDNSPEEEIVRFEPDGVVAVMGSKRILAKEIIEGLISEPKPLRLVAGPIYDSVEGSKASRIPILLTFAPRAVKL